MQVAPRCPFNGPIERPDKMDWQPISQESQPSEEVLGCERALWAVNKATETMPAPRRPEQPHPDCGRGGGRARQPWGLPYNGFACAELCRKESVPVHQKEAAIEGRVSGDGMTQP